MDTNTQHTIATTEAAQQAGRIAGYADTVEGFEIHDDDALGMAGDLIKDMRFYRAAIEDKRKSLVQPLNNVVKDINALFKPPRDQIDQLLASLKKKQDQYVIRREAAEAAARRKAEAEERERSQRLREAAEKTAEATGQSDNVVVTTMQQQADELDKRADKIAASKTAATRGEKASVSVVRTWKAEVVDIKAVCLAIAEGRLPAQLISVSQSEIDELARALEAEKTVDGLRYFQQIKTVSR